MADEIMNTPLRKEDTPPVIRNAVRKDLPALTAILKALFAIEEDFVFDEQKQRRGLSLMTDGCGKHRIMLLAERHNEGGIDFHRKHGWQTTQRVCSRKVLDV